MADGTNRFDPSRHLTKISGSDYLAVKWRLLWLRQEHPDAVIDTELMAHADQMAIFRARVTLPGGGSATGWGSETYGDFRDYLEKAESKALGRALAALGYGTQFAGDSEADDAPAASSRSSAASSQAASSPPAAQGAINTLHGRAEKLGFDHDALHDLAMHHCGVDSMTQLTGAQLYALNKLLDNPDDARHALAAARTEAAPAGQAGLPGAAGANPMHADASRKGRTR